MKKLFSILIALALLAGVNTLAFAAEAKYISYSGGLNLGTLKTVTLVNNTSSSTVSFLPKTNTTEALYGYAEPGLIPGKIKILGFDVAVYGAGTATYGTAALVDAIAFEVGTDIICESEASVTTAAAKIFPAGIGLQYGLIVDQSPYTIVTVYFVQDIG